MLEGNHLQYKYIERVLLILVKQSWLNPSTIQVFVTPGLHIS